MSLITSPCLPLIKLFHLKYKAFLFEYNQEKFNKLINPKFYIFKNFQI